MINLLQHTHTHYNKPQYLIKILGFIKKSIRLIQIDILIKLIIIFPS